MRHFIPLALAACLGTAAVSTSLPAAAGVVVSVGVPLPGVAVGVLPPVVAPWPYYYGVAPRVYYPGYVGYGWGVGYRYGFPGYHGVPGYHLGYRPGFGHPHVGYRR